MCIYIYIYIFTHKYYIHVYIYIYTCYEYTEDKSLLFHGIFTGIFAAMCFLVIFERIITLSSCVQPVIIGDVQ